MPSPLIQNLFSALLDSPSIVVEVAAQTLEKAIPVIQSHFTFTGYEITKAYQDACRYSFVAISIGLDAPDSLIKKLRYPKVTREFARQINEFYFQEFAEKNEAIDVVSFVKSLKNLQEWQVQHQQILAIQNRFAIKLEQMQDWLQDIKDDIGIRLGIRLGSKLGIRLDI